MPRSFAPGATIACVPSGETPSPPPPSVPSAIAADDGPAPGLDPHDPRRRAGDGRGAGAWPLTQACPRGVDADAGGAVEPQPAHEPPGREVEDRDLPAVLDDRPRASPVIAMSIGVPASLSSAIRREPAVSTSSTAPLRAAHTRVPSALTASASGVPCIRMLPAPVRVARSMIETVRPGGDVGARPVRRRGHRARLARQRDRADDRVGARVDQDRVRRAGGDDHDPRLGGGGREDQQGEGEQERAHESG